MAVQVVRHLVGDSRQVRGAGVQIGTWFLERVDGSSYKLGAMLARAGSRTVRIWPSWKM